MNRAFSAGDLRCINSWGVAPGSNETAPLALNMYLRPAKRLQGLAAIEREPIEVCVPIANVDAFPPLQFVHEIAQPRVTGGQTL